MNDDALAYTYSNEYLLPSFQFVNHGRCLCCGQVVVWAPSICMRMISSSLSAWSILMTKDSISIQIWIIILRISWMRADNGFGSLGFPWVKTGSVLITLTNRCSNVPRLSVDSVKISLFLIAKSILEMTVANACTNRW
jgi:hypothetical protein